MSVLAGEAVVVLGLARSGEAAARAAAEAGATVTVLDGADEQPQRERAQRLASVTVILGRTDANDVDGATLVVTSPGVPWHSRWLEAARAQRIPIWSEVELAFRLGRAPAVAITGTNGKTTTTEMTVAALNAAGRPAVAAGNIGAPLVEAPTDRLIVAELSSFQLEHIDRFRAPVAVLLNIAPDHLDRHGTFQDYARAKGRIVENARDGDAVVVRADPLCGAVVAGTRARQIPFLATSVPLAGAGVEEDEVVVPEGVVMRVDELAARSRGFVEDAVAAAAAACALGADPREVGRGLAAYRPGAHRMEPVAIVGGVAFINDSKATDPHATLTALEGLTNVILIAGGRNKGLELEELSEGAPSLRAVIAIGEAAEEVAQAFADAGVPVEPAASMDEAVERARAIARAGDTVLLSPACASFDMFDGYEARGEAFRSAVKRLEGSHA